MNIKAINGIVETIRANKHDAEAAHTIEEALLVEVLEAIASGDHTVSAASLASAALKSREIDFDRWTA